MTILAAVAREKRCGIAQFQTRLLSGEMYIVRSRKRSSSASVRGRVNKRSSGREAASIHSLASYQLASCQPVVCRLLRALAIRLWDVGYCRWAAMGSVLHFCCVYIAVHSSTHVAVAYVHFYMYALGDMGCSRPGLHTSA